MTDTIQTPTDSAPASEGELATTVQSDPTSRSERHELITSEPTAAMILKRRVGVGAAAVAAGLALAVLVVVPLVRPAAQNDAPPEVAALIATPQPTAAVTPQPEPAQVVPVEEPTQVADETAGPIVPEGAGRFVKTETVRLIDTRTDKGQPLDPGASVSLDVGEVVPAGSSAIVFSVSVAASTGAGEVTIALDGAPITVIEVGGPGQMTTNLAFAARGSESSAVVTTIGGGHLVVDVVGYFEPVTESRSGRFVDFEPQVVGRLVTETDGREVTFDPLTPAGVDPDGVDSVLVRVRADVGADGGRVRLGQTLDALQESMMWAPTSTTDRTRFGTAIVSLSELDTLALTYNGGSVLELDLLGYFTDESAEISSTGLFVPVEPELLFDSAVPALTSSVVAVDSTNLAADSTVAEQVASVLLSVTGVATDPGQLLVYDRTLGLSAAATAQLGSGAARIGLLATPLDDGGNVAIFSEVDADVRLELHGWFTKELLAE